MERLAITENRYGVTLVPLTLALSFLPSFKLSLESLAEMTAVKALRPSRSSGMFRSGECRPSAASPPPPTEKLGFAKLYRINAVGFYPHSKGMVLRAPSNSLKPIKAKEDIGGNDNSRKCSVVSAENVKPNWFKPIKAKLDSDSSWTEDCAVFSGKNIPQMSNVGKSTNILWHDCPIHKHDRQQLLQQKGCVIWLTGLSGSGKSTLACALSRSLHSRGKLTYILDGDNIRHGLNRDLSFRAEDRSENIRRIGEVAKLFSDAGLICITSLISPYQKDREACRSLLPEGDFIEVFIDVPLDVCEARDPKGLYKLARSGKIKGFTGIDDPYEPPSSCEIVLQQNGSDCKSPSDMAEIVISYLEEKGYLRA